MIKWFFFWHELDFDLNGSFTNIVQHTIYLMAQLILWEKRKNIYIEPLFNQRDTERKKYRV